MTRSPVTRVAKGVLAAAAAAGLFFGGMAWAGNTGVVKMYGGQQIQTKIATGDEWQTVTGGTLWEDVYGAALTVHVPAGGARLVTAHFSAESYCTAASWCAMRIVARRGADGPSVELYPRGGSGFAFDDDENGSEIYEANAFDRSIRLGSSGTWTVWAQARAVGGDYVYLDDWYFEVDVIATS